MFSDIPNASGYIITIGIGTYSPHTNIYCLAIPSINSGLQNTRAACWHVTDASMLSFESATPESLAPQTIDFLTAH